LEKVTRIEVCVDDKPKRGVKKGEGAGLLEGEHVQPDLRRGKGKGKEEDIKYRMRTEVGKLHGTVVKGRRHNAAERQKC